MTGKLANWKRFLCTYTNSLDKILDVHTILAVEFAWDPAKARENIGVHGIDFADAVGVFDNPYLPWEDPDAEGEKRFVALGLDVLGRLLLVVYTYRPGKIRLISARKASKKEEKEYAQRV
ncbi:MAG: BrnT family toxin [Thermodesulfobacteriota bacterium]